MTVWDGVSVALFGLRCVKLPPFEASMTSGNFDELACVGGFDETSAGS